MHSRVIKPAININEVAGESKRIREGERSSRPWRIGGFNCDTRTKESEASQDR